MDPLPLLLVVIFILGKMGIASNVEIFSFECISAANLIRIAIFYLNHEFQKYLGNEFLLLKKSKVDQTMEEDFPTYQVLKSQKFDVEFPIGNKGRGTMSPG